MSVSQSCQLVLQSCLKDRRPRERSLPLSLRCFSFSSLSVFSCRLVIPFAKYLKFDIEELVSKVSHNSFTNYFRDLGTFTHLSSEETLPQKDFSVTILAVHLLSLLEARRPFSWIPEKSLFFSKDLLQDPNKYWSHSLFKKSAFST